MHQASFLLKPNVISKNRLKKNSEATLKFSSTFWLRVWIEVLKSQEQLVLRDPDPYKKGIALT